LREASFASDPFSLLPSHILVEIHSYLVAPTSPYAFNRHHVFHSLRHASPSVFTLSQDFGNSFWEAVIVREMEGFVTLDLGSGSSDGGDNGNDSDEQDDDERWSYRLWITLRSSTSVRNRRRIARFVAGVMGWGDVKLLKGGKSRDPKF
jgi:hypothetical protein